MPDEILYGAPGSTFVRKPRILLQEKGISFITEAVNTMLEVSDEFIEISPLRKIPVFRDDEFVVVDSSAICCYIDKKYLVFSLKLSVTTSGIGIGIVIGIFVALLVYAACKHVKKDSGYTELQDSDEAVASSGGCLPFCS